MNSEVLCRDGSELASGPHIAAYYERVIQKLVATGRFELADYIKKAIGEVGSGKDYYQSGR